MYAQLNNTKYSKQNKETVQPASTCSNLTMETPKQCVKFVQS